MGLVSEQVTAGTLEERVRTLAQDLKALPGDSVGAMKQLIERCVGDANTTSWLAELETFDYLLRRRKAQPGEGQQ